MQELSVEFVVWGKLRVNTSKTKLFSGKICTCTLAYGGIVVSVVLWLTVVGLNSISAFFLGMGWEPISALVLWHESGKFHLVVMRHL